MEATFAEDVNKAEAAWRAEKDPANKEGLWLILKDAKIELKNLRRQQVAVGVGADDSDRLCKQLLEVKVDPLPDNAGQLQDLLESGKVPVTQAIFHSVRQVHQRLLTPGLGSLAEQFGTHIPLGFCGPGEAGEPNALLIMVLLIKTWRIMCHFAPINHRFDFSWGRNQGLASVDQSGDDPSTGRVRPDLTIVASRLLLFFGEQTASQFGLGAACDEVRNKLGEGLSPVYYQNITFIPFMIAAGDLLQFGMLHRSGKPELCSHVLNLTHVHDRIVLMQIAINLYRLLLALDGQAPDLRRRAQQGVPEYRPENTIIICHRFKIEKVNLFFDYFCMRFGHSFEDIKAAYELSIDQEFMVHAECPELRETRPGSVNNKRQRGSSHYKVVITRPGGPSPSLEDVTEIHMKQVMLAGLRCAKLLATASLVHRDLRLANFFWDKDGPFVGDLELAAKAPLQVTSDDLPMLKDWTDDTLDADGNYTLGSDVHQLGVLLENWLMAVPIPADSAEQASNLVEVLQSKVPAHEALCHDWLKAV